MIKVNLGQPLVDAETLDTE
jgi:hypothetical protein